MPKPLPAVTLDPQSPVFKTRDAAANAVSIDFPKYPNEQAAVVIKRPDGTFGYSTKTSQDAEGFALRALLPKGYSLAATVHSHPGDDARAGVFSPDDLQSAQQLGVPAFVRFSKDNSIRQYIPGVTKTQKTTMSGDKFGVNTAIGDPVALDPPATTPAIAASAPRPGSTASLVGDVVNRDDPVTQEQ
jgi:hypothetical protein